MNETRRGALVLCGEVRKTGTGGLFPVGRSVAELPVRGGPVSLRPRLRQQLDDVRSGTGFRNYSEQSEDGRVFVGPTGVTPGRADFSSIWTRAR